MSFLDTLKKAFGIKNDRAVYLQGFKKSKSVFGDQLKSLKDNFNGIDDEFLEQLTIVLLESDIGIDTADLIAERLKKMSEDYPKVTFDWAMGFLLQIMKELYEETPDAPPVFNENGPTVILLEGVNGSGKTTTAAKLAAM